MTRITCAFAAVMLMATVSRALKIPQVHRWKKLKQQYPLAVFEAQGDVLGNDQFGWHYTVMGGFTKFPQVTKQVWSIPLFNRNDKTKWTKLAPMPVALTHMAQASHNQIYFGVGGYHGPHPGRSTREVWKYDRVKNKWTWLPRLPARRAGGGLIYYTKGGARHLIYSGGVDRPNYSMEIHKDYGTTWRLDLDRLHLGWVNENANLPHPRNHMSAVESCGRYFWVGGQRGRDEHDGNSRVVSEYLPAQKKWSPKPPAPLPYGLGHISASVFGYRCGILVVAGTTWQRSKTRNILFWEPTQNKWHFIGKFPKRVSTPICGLRKNVLICGTGETHNRREIFFTRISFKNI